MRGEIFLAGVTPFIAEGSSYAPPADVIPVTCSSNGKTVNRSVEARAG